MVLSVECVPTEGSELSPKASINRIQIDNSWGVGGGVDGAHP